MWSEDDYVNRKKLNIATPSAIYPNLKPAADKHIEDLLSAGSIEEVGGTHYSPGQFIPKKTTGKSISYWL